MTVSTLTKEEFHGIHRHHIHSLVENKNIGIHSRAKKDFSELQQAATAEGIKIRVISGFRSFESQLDIWNQKIKGIRPVRDTDGKAIEIKTISKKSLVFHILRWSALPGFSRHHWGSELDVYDLAANKTPQLIPSEYENDGVYFPLTTFLNKNMHRFNFYRPYACDSGGVAPEPWHLSYAPVSLACEKQLSIESAYDFLFQYQNDILLGDIVLANFEDIFKRFILNTSSPPS